MVWLSIPGLVIVWNSGGPGRISVLCLLIDVVWITVALPNNLIAIVLQFSAALAADLDLSS